MVSTARKTNNINVKKRVVQLFEAIKTILSLFIFFNKKTSRVQKHSQAKMN